MANRKGVFIGAYVPNHLKESLRRRAAAEHRTLSQEITRILEEAVHGGAFRPAVSTGAREPLNLVGHRPLRCLDPDRAASRTAWPAEKTTNSFGFSESSND